MKAVRDKRNEIYGPEYCSKVDEWWRAMDKIAHNLHIAAGAIAVGSSIAGAGGVVSLYTSGSLTCEQIYECKVQFEKYYKCIVECRKTSAAVGGAAIAVMALSLSAMKTMEMYAESYDVAHKLSQLQRFIDWWKLQTRQTVIEEHLECYIALQFEADFFQRKLEQLKNKWFDFGDAVGKCKLGLSLCNDAIELTKKYQESLARDLRPRLIG